MEGKDAIIEKILSDANAQAEAILADASAYGEKIVSAAQAEAKAAVAEAQANAEKSSLEYITRRMTVCELDIKKIKLAAKKQVIDEVFDRAAEKLKALSGDAYKKVVTGMLKAGAEDGDVVTVAKDEKVINAAFLANYQKQTGVKLTLDKEYGDFVGGFVLHGKGVDKNMTFEVELKSLREEYEAQVAQRLFGEVH